MSYLQKYFHSVTEEKRSSAAIAYLAALDHIHSQFPLIADKIGQELKDQRSYLKLIASENYSSLTVQLAMGNLLTDKYSEGIPHRRFYAGCENVDEIEEAAINELKSIFQCDHAYVQPHSGADANLVAYWAIIVKRIQNKEVEALGKKSVDELSAEEYERVRQLMVNQKVLGLSLGSGGHLTHGYRHNISSKFMRSSFYDVDKKTGLIDYSHLREQVLREKPAIIVAGYSAYPRLIDFAKMREIADLVGATLLVDMAHFAGLVAGKAIQGEFNPVPFAHVVTSTTHKTMRGPRGGFILCGADFREVVDKGCPLVLGGPLPHAIAAKAIAFKEANRPSFRLYAQQIIANARALAEHLLSRGVRLATGGTDNHLLLLDVMSSFSLTGRQAELALRQARFTVNRNALPFDPQGPWYTSGVRLGTPALTTLGMKEGEMREIAELMFALLRSSRSSSEGQGAEAGRGKVDVDSPILLSVQKSVEELLKRFPLYPEIVI
ncbi:MAG: glycine hydroxymethyltransferase [Anaerolineae bacterium]